MDKLGSIAKGGWHPESTGSVKNDLKSIVGRGDNGYAKARQRAEAHNSTPLSALKDPSSFAPPPKRNTFPDSDASNSPVASGSSSGRPVPVSSRSNTANVAGQDLASNEDEGPPSGPFRVDTTGLSTANLPKPPIRRAEGVPTQPTASSNVSRAAALPMPFNNGPATAAKTKKPGPPLPPRLPPRGAVAGSTNIPSDPPPSYSHATTSTAQSEERHGQSQLLNQGALNRLGAAGVSVPGLDIGSRNNQIESSSSQSQHPEPIRAKVSELQSRFAALGSAVNAREAEGSGTSAASGKRPVPLPKKQSLSTNPTSSENFTPNDQRKPPPIPMGTKPR